MVKTIVLVGGGDSEDRAAEAYSRTREGERAPCSCSPTRAEDAHSHTRSLQVTVVSQDREARSPWWFRI